MTDINVLNEQRVIPNVEFNLAEYVKPLFEMYGGHSADVVLQFKNHLANVVVDRFGKDVYMRREDENSFITKVRVAISPTFLSWVMEFGNDAEIISPDWVIDELLTLVNKISDQYKNRKQNPVQSV